MNELRSLIQQKLEEIQDIEVSAELPDDVIEENKRIIACGAIGPYYDSKTESSLFTIFVDSEYQGKGYGRKIIETLEQDEYFLRAERIEIPASMSAIPFYRKMGYEHKNGELIFHDGHFALEKFNKPTKNC